MKRIFSIIAICLTLVLAIPAVPVNAANISRSNIYVRTRTSIGTPWPDYAVNQNFMLNSVWLEDSFVSAVNDCLDNFDYSLFSNYDYYWLSAYSDNYTLFSLQMILFNSSQDPLIYGLNVSYNQQTAQTSARSSSLVPVCDDPHILVCSCQFNSSGMVSSQWTSDPLVLTSSFGSGGLYYNSQTVGCALLDTNCGKYWWSVNVDALWANNDHQGYSNKFDWCLNNQDRVTNYWDNFPGYNSQGSLVDDPSSSVVEVESNSNHMYFKGCEIGFCEPYNQNNFSNYGGAYVYIRYQVDDWIVNHISDYSLDIQLLKVVGSNQETYSKSVLLDRDGCVEIPLSDFSRDGTAVPNSGFDVAVVNSVVEDNYYKSYLYCVQGDLANFVSKNSGVDITSHTYNNPWGSLKDGVLSSIYFYQVTTETYNLMDNQALQAAIAARQTYNPYIFRIQVNLVSGEDRSGDVATKFDLVTGDQSDVSTSGFVNPDPFIPDTSDPNYLPSVPGDNSTTPSTIVYTGGTFSGFFNGSIGFDPGYRELKQDIDSDPNGNFTQYLAPFENNEVGGFVGDFLDDMPTALKTIFVGGFGVLTLLGIYRFIRRG